MARKPTRKTLIARLDNLCRDIIWARDRSICRHCYKSLRREQKEGNVHHIIPKKRGYHVRWVLNNLILFCPKCHFWWHEDPFAMTWLMFNDHEAHDVVQELNQNQTQMFKQQDLLEWIDTLEQVKRGMS